MPIRDSQKASLQWRSKGRPLKPGKRRLPRNAGIPCRNPAAATRRGETFPLIPPGLRPGLKVRRRYAAILLAL
jgi:hypothetical protein